jgi:hypothetical protein
MLTGGRAARGASQDLTFKPLEHLCSEPAIDRVTNQTHERQGGDVQKQKALARERCKEAEGDKVGGNAPEPAIGGHTEALDAARDQEIPEGIEQEAGDVVDQLGDRVRRLDPCPGVDQRLHEFWWLQCKTGQPGGWDGRPEFPEAKAGKPANDEMGERSC